ncbi:type B 50S ribosomal protein L31 [Candidatus Nomurabacteria bacterium]|nr:type B 50S ribosomal protein L31 [Candidatus Nomurabacteria bacterium]
MKTDIHPEVNPVVFVDTSCGVEFVTTSTMKSEETRDIDGVTHYVINLEISSASHPFFTGKQVFVDTARRVEKFQEKMKKVEAKQGSATNKKAKRAAKAAKKEDKAAA